MCVDKIHQFVIQTIINQHKRRWKDSKNSGKSLEKGIEFVAALTSLRLNLKYRTDYYLQTIVEKWKVEGQAAKMANISVTTASENLIKAMNEHIIPNQEYLLQGSIMDSAVEHLLHRWMNEWMNE